MNSTNNTVAGAAVTSPIWLPWLQHGSEIAALITPILGAVWLSIQIIGYCRRRYKEWKIDKERNS